jgi:hypothetical protein
MTMSDWFESTEGDLDPDLTEEAGYGGWDPPTRSWWTVAYQAIALLALVSIVGAVVLVVVR